MEQVHASSASGQMNQEARPDQGGQGAGKSTQGKSTQGNAAKAGGDGQQSVRRQSDSVNQGVNQGGTGREVSNSGANDRAVAGANVTVVPPVDIFEDELGFTLLADMPGVSKEQLTVRVMGDNLVIEGTANVPAAGEMQLVYGEVQSPQYRRSFTLSRELDPGKIEAKLDNGVLRLTIPKAEEARPRQINVSVG